MGRVTGNDLPRDQVIEQHAKGREMLLDRRWRARVALHIGSDGQWCDGRELVDSLLVAPGEESPECVEIGTSGVWIPDARREELGGALIGA